MVSSIILILNILNLKTPPDNENDIAKNQIRIDNDFNFEEAVGGHY